MSPYHPEFWQSIFLQEIFHKNNQTIHLYRFSQYERKQICTILSWFWTNPYYLISYHIISPDIISYHLISYHINIIISIISIILSYHIVYHIIYHIISYITSISYHQWHANWFDIFGSKKTIGNISYTVCDLSFKLATRCDPLYLTHPVVVLSLHCFDGLLFSNPLFLFIVII